jgi:hypothetical protein
MRLRHPRLAWLMGLICVAGLADCGPAPTDTTTRLEPRANLGRPSPSPSFSQHAQAPHTDPFTPASSTAPFSSNHSPNDHVQARPAEPLVGVDRMSAALASPDVRVRLWALDHWEQYAPTGSIDPLIVALDDEDEDVQARASEILDRYWTVELEQD